MPTHAALANAPPRVLITGAAGRIGSALAADVSTKYSLRLMVAPSDANAEKIAGLGEIVEADLCDPTALRAAFDGVDVCVHLAADARPHAPWNDLLPANIVGAYNIFAAAKSAGCRRVVFASSIHAVSGYAPDVQVKANEPVNPGDLYGVSKCFGEALARYMAEQEGVSVVVIRIGAYQPEPAIAGDDGLQYLDSWISPRDMNQLICRAIDASDVTFAIVHGVSNNRFKRLDVSSGRDILGYAPQDDASVTNAAVRPLRLPEHAIRHNLKDSPNPRADSGLRDQLPPT